MNVGRFAAVAGLQLRLGWRPLVRVAFALLVGLLLLEVVTWLAVREPLPRFVTGWRIAAFLLLPIAFLAGVVRGGDELRAQAVLCPVFVSRRAFVSAGVLARTGGVVIAAAAALAVGRALVGAPGEGWTWGRIALLLLWMVELALLTSLLSVLVPGEANALATVVLLAGAAVAVVNGDAQAPPGWVTALLPILSDPQELPLALGRCAATNLALAAALAATVRERA